MYLTKLIPDLRHPGARQCFYDCQDMHRSLMKAFPKTTDDPIREEYNVLYRVMSDRTVLMYSRIPPDAEQLRKCGFAIQNGKDVSALYSVLKSGQILQFRLSAVPAKKTNNNDGKNSRRTFLKTTDERTEWLIRKGSQNGFKVLSAAEVGELKIYGKHNGTSLIFAAMEWSGVLQITDTDAFWNALCNGIGAEKAYGMGMILISR